MSSVTDEVDGYCSPGPVAVAVITPTPAAKDLSSDFHTEMKCGECLIKPLPLASPKNGLTGFHLNTSSAMEISTPSSILSSLGLSEKKSNLRKCSRYETSPNGTPKDPNPTPNKRIRIVENFDRRLENIGATGSGDEEGDEGLLNPNDEDEDDPMESFLNTSSFRTESFGENIEWVSRSSSVQLDMTIVNAETVRMSRFPVPKKFSVEIDMRFIDNETVEQIIQCKDSINSAGPFAYEKLCLESCRFPEIRRPDFRTSSPKIRSFDVTATGNSFLYEANAMKMANLDAAVDFDLTFPKHFFETQNSENPTIFYFGDIWSTSKGFREYILWKCQELIDSKGMICKGFALNASYCATRPEKTYNEKAGLLFNCTQMNGGKDEQRRMLGDYDLTNVPTELVEHFVGEGDLLDTIVTDGFVQQMLEGTGGEGVHLLVADNVECFNVHETVREIRFQRNMYCQCIIALLSLRTGGNFVVKIFDSITLFTVGLIFLMHRCFKSISIHKPKTSPCHSSERFLICRSKLDKELTDDIEQFLLESHAMVVKNEEIRRILRKKIRRKLEIQKMEVKELVPLRVIINDSEFFEYIRSNNIRFSQNFVLAINELLSKVKLGKELMVKEPNNDDELKTRLGVDFSDSLFMNKNFEKPDNIMSYLLSKYGCNPDSWKSRDKILSSTRFKEMSKNPSDWRVFVIQDGGDVLLSSGRGLFVGMGETKPLFFDGRAWSPVDIERLKLTKGTVFYGQIVEQISERNGFQKIELTCKILDTLFISGRYIGDLPFHQRKSLSKCYAQALSKTTHPPNIPVLSAQDSSELGELSDLLNSFYEMEITGYSKRFRVHKYPSENGTSIGSITVGGLLFWNIRGPGNTFLSSMSERIVSKLKPEGKGKQADDEEDSLLLIDVMALQI